MIWYRLLGRLDYHHRKWYEFIDSNWEEISTARAFWIIDDFHGNVADIVKLMRYRDGDAHARSRAKT
jgi:hypothetical protein